MPRKTQMDLELRTTGKHISRAGQSNGRVVPSAAKGHLTHQSSDGMHPMRTILTLHCYSGRALSPKLLPSCLWTKTQWPMPCHGVPWHHPLGKVLLPHSEAVILITPAIPASKIALLQMYMIRTWHAGLQSRSSSSPHRDILTLKMSVSSKSEFSLWSDDSLPCFPLLSRLLTALWA